MSHIKQTKSGLIWSFINQFGRQGITIIVTIVLARLVPPSEFGLIGMVTVFINFASIFIDFGFSSVLIQKDEVTSQDLDTVFFCNVIVSIFLFVLFTLSAPIIARFYNEPTLVLITRIASLSFLISPIASVKPALAAKAMDFKLITKVSLISLLSGSIVGIVMALFGFGVWSIVFQTLVSGFISAVYFLFITDYRPKFRFYKSSFNQMIKVGGSIIGDTTVNYWTRNADNLLIGKFLGESALGIYSRSYSLMLLPLTNITRVIIRVMLPSFSKIKKDIAETKRIYIKTVQVIAALVFPIMFGLSAAAEIFVLVVFGSKWIAMVPLIRVLSIVGAIQSILALNGSIYVSQGKANIAFRITIIFNLIFLSGFTIGLFVGGLEGVAYSYFITTLIGAIPNLYYAIRLIKVSIYEVLIKLWKIFTASTLMGIAIWQIFSFQFFNGWNQNFTLIVMMLIGILIYCLLIYILRIEIYFELKNRVVKKLKLRLPIKYNKIS